MKPVLYLDVDDTILMFPPWRDKAWWEANKGGAPAPLVQEFLTWADETCEVRWLTAWTLSGQMEPRRREELARLLKVSVELLAKFDNPLGWGFRDAKGLSGKLWGINWDEVTAGREWAWVEDGISPEEKEYLERNGYKDRYYYTNTSHHPEHLEQTWNKLIKRWG